MDDKEKLIAYLRNLNVTFVEIDAHEYRELTRYELKDNAAETNFREAPFTSGIGLVWGPKTIYALPDVKWPHILHEAGHLLTEKYPVNDSRNKECEDSFFGWEWLIVKKLGLDKQAFLDANSEYSISWNGTADDDAFYSEVKDLTTPELVEGYFAQNIEYAKTLGIISADNEPLVMR